MEIHKEKIAGPEKTVTGMVKKFFSEMRDGNLTPKERMKKIGRILFAALAGKYLGEALTGKLKKKGEKVSEKAEDRHNVELLEIMPEKKQELETVVEQYNSHKKRYETVAKATGIPGMLICAIHYREGFGFDRYLHNGEQLGQPTTHAPAGILFKEGEWEKAAIHALGGNVVDAKGHKSMGIFLKLREELGLTASSKDFGAMMAFAEKYNGMGYRGKGVRSCYVYGGTSLNQAGQYTADHVFNSTSTDRRLGVAAIVMGIQAMESGEPLRIAGSTTNQDQHKKAA